jgi:o-succinylbenzoate synthase
LSTINSQFLIQFQSYRYRFRQPIQTNHGTWEIREGIIVSLQDESTGKIGYGEIAPIPWFGSETLERAREFCESLAGKITIDRIYNIPDRLPACQFAFESAVTDISTIEDTNVNRDSISLSYLLPAGEAALQGWQNSYRQGATTFKWKIGVREIEIEIELFRQLRQALPSSVNLRLDANGGLSVPKARQWLEVIDELGGVEFLEQPLGVDRASEILELSRNYHTTLALDESVAKIAQLRQWYERGWCGVFVIKAAIIGSPRQLSEFCRDKTLDLVFSSVFETEIGRKAAFRLAEAIGSSRRSLGFGVSSFR